MGFRAYRDKNRCSFGKKRRFMAKGGRCAEIHRKGRTPVLRARRRWRNGLEEVVTPVEAGEQQHNADEVDKR